MTATRPSRPLSIAALATTVSLAALALPAQAAAPADERAAPAAGAAATRTVTVADDFFSPRRLTVARGTTIRWRWSRANGNTHDVRLTRRPRGVRRFHSPAASRGFSFSRRLGRAGGYRMICTFHDGMAMQVTVRR